MARRRQEHEEHVNTEAWAIPYGDLITLLLAFFVVMYAISSVNEGKYRVLSDSLVAAFRGQPHTMKPLAVGSKLAPVAFDETPAAVKPSQALKFQDEIPDPVDRLAEVRLNEMVTDLENALRSLIDKELIRIRREASWVEVEIRTDILFPSGSAEIEPDAVSVLERLAGILLARTYPVRVEGHTDDRPIHTVQFPSNWELSAARAARIVRLFEGHGIPPTRLLVAGFGEHRPAADNATAEGRNRNRRIAIVILGDDPSSQAPVYAEPPHTAPAGFEPSARQSVPGSPESPPLPETSA